jgi:hypothetical protein
MQLLAWQIWTNTKESRAALVGYQCFGQTRATVTNDSALGPLVWGRLAKRFSRKTAVGPVSLMEHSINRQAVAPWPRV